MNPRIGADAVANKK